MQRENEGGNGEWCCKRRVRVQRAGESAKGVVFRVLMKLRVTLVLISLRHQHH